MSKIQDIVNRNFKIAIACCILLVCWSLWYVITANQTPIKTTRIFNVYYYDMGSNEIFLARNNEIPPIIAPSGKLGVRAYVFACGRCRSEVSRFIGWLEMYTPEAKDALTRPDPVRVDRRTGQKYYSPWENGHRISIPGQKNWAQASSKAGNKIMRSIKKRCRKKRPPVRCLP